MEENYNCAITVNDVKKVIQKREKKANCQAIAKL